MWRKEQQLAQQEEKKDQDMPLVDKQLRHDRIRRLSLGLNLEERPVGEPHKISWPSHLESLGKIGLKLNAD